MQLKRLELVGFKSFLEKGRFDFTSKSTAIVGPNGCGKSNIVDAIKWVTGELSFKELRGRSMEDLVFAGSELRPPTGMAEVSLTLDNADGAAPTEYKDFSEITVTRRVFRDGTSEFEINKVPCRLRDIVDLFLDTGIGRAHYSIIEQGRVGLVVSSKPEDRRLIIEEAAGITKFKHRKKAAERKMDYTRQNLLRVSDVLGELKRQINSLQRAAKKAERFRKFRDRAKELDIALSARNEGLVRDAVADLSRNESELSDHVTQEHTELQAGDAALEKERLALLEEEKKLEEAQTNLFSMASRIQGMESQADSLRREIENLREKASGSRFRAEVLEKEVGVNETRIEELDHLAEELGAESETLTATLEMLAKEEAALAESVAGMEREVESTKSSLFEFVAREAELRNDLVGIRDRVSELTRQQETREREMENIRDELTALEYQYRERQTSLGLTAQLRFGFQREQRESKTHVERIKSERATLENRLSTLNQVIEGDRSRLKALTDFAEKYQGYREGVRAVMERRRNPETPLGEVKGLLGELVRPHRGYERAVEAALSDKIECLVVDHPKEAMSPIQFLKDEKRGRGVFLPLKLAQHRQPIQVPEHEGISGRLVDYVDIDPNYRDGIEALLHDSLLVESLPRAISLWEEGIHFTMVTREGDMINRQGIVVGGSWGEEERGVLEVRREMGELRETVAARESQREVIRRKLKKLVREIIFAEAGLSRVEEALNQESLNALNHEREFDRLEEGLSRAKENLDVVATEIQRLIEERKSLELNSAATSLDLEACRKKHAEVEIDLKLATEKIGGERESLRIQAGHITEGRVRKASLDERLESQARERESLAEQVRRGVEERTELLHTAEESENEAVRLDTQITEISELRQSTVLEHDQKRAQLDEMKREHETRSSTIWEQESRLKERRAEVERLQESLSAARLAVQEEKTKIHQLQLQVQERYGISLVDFVSSPDFKPLGEEEIEAAQSELEVMREKIAKIGDVNLASIDELKELEERFGFLTTQKDDLEKTLTELSSAIRKINATTRQRFQETFDEVNRRFQEIFPRMFRGGKAKLILTDPENVLETGVDIMAQPPGKRLQNMNLLSGGEKALVAISVIFAIFQYKAPPFCLLDEVDAPLDDENVHRFCAMVKEMSDQTQFVIITHNKGTMEIAENLYGITMEEPGVSRLVSVRIQGEEGARRREEDEATQAVAQLA